MESSRRYKRNKRQTTAPTFIYIFVKKFFLFSISTHTYSNCFEPPAFRNKTSRRINRSPNKNRAQTDRAKKKKSQRRIYYLNGKDCNNNHHRSTNRNNNNNCSFNFHITFTYLRRPQIRMMNQSEIDAGPPNKKPKIGTNTNVIMPGSAVVNGLSAQMSETGLCYHTRIQKRFVTTNNLPFRR